MANKEHLSDAYVRLNPQHTVPMLTVEKGESLWDSHAIAMYLIERYADRAASAALYPRTDLLVRARIQQRLHFDTSVLFPVVCDVYRAFAMAGVTTVPEKIADEANAVYAMLETFLAAGGGWLVGDAMTVADLFAITSVTQIAQHVPVDALQHVRLAAWMARFEPELPYFAEVNTMWVADYAHQMEGMIAANEAKKLNIMAS